MKEVLSSLNRSNVKIDQARAKIQEAIQEWSAALRDIKETQRKLRQLLSRPSD